MKKLLVALFLLLAAAPMARADSDPTPYYVPPPQFSAQMQVMALGFSNAFALFRNGTASFSFDAASKSISRLRVAIDVTSLISNHQGTQRDLFNLLNAIQYPEIGIVAPDSVTFKDGKAELKATVTMGGVSKPVTLQAVLNHVGKNPVGDMWATAGDAVGLSLHADLKRADFGMGDDPSAGMPAVFGNTISLSIELQGIQQ